MSRATPVQQILDALPDTPTVGQRYVIAIAGPPAAGKSTLAEELCSALAPRAAVLGLDAYHYDNTVLSERGDLQRKGAPHTFDVDSYRRTLEFLRSEPAAEATVPVFDRQLDLSRNAAAVVLPSHSFVITEGNYLLLDETPWAQLAELFDLTISVTAPLELVQARILERWQGHGFDDDTGRRRLADNDLPNAKLTIERSRPADITINAR